MFFLFDLIVSMEALKVVPEIWQGQDGETQLKFRKTCDITKIEPRKIAKESYPAVYDLKFIEKKRVL